MTPQQVADLARDYAGMTPEKLAAGQVSLSLRWALEIERSVINILWHYPEYLGLVQRELDLRVHFTLPAYRHVLEALQIVAEKCGTADWASVLECVCEIPGAFDECGGKEGLNRIFTDDNRYPESVRPEFAEPILKDRIRFLKEAAIVRGTDPTKPVLHYTVGWGVLRRNKLAIKSQHPVAIGEIRCCFCGRTSALAAWPQGDNGLKLKGTPERSK
jgi:hypothetical protein